MRFIVVSCLVVLLELTGGACTTADAQEATVPKSTVPVLVMVTEGNPPADNAIVITRRSAEGYRIVMARSQATPANLRAALSSVQKMLDRDGNSARGGDIIRVTGRADRPVVNDRSSRALLDRILEARTVAAGSARSATIYMQSASSRTQ